MTTPSSDDERFEHIPWEQMAPIGNRNKLLYAIAGAILIAGLTAAAVRGGGSTTNVISTPTTTAPATPLAPTGQTIDPASVTSTSAGASEHGGESAPQNWSEADLFAFPADSLAREAGAIAEWVASDFFTIDGGAESVERLSLVLPAESVLPTAPPAARSFVEWARAVSVEESAPGFYQVLVVVRRLGAGEGESYRRIQPVGVIISLAWGEEGWSVVDLPLMADAPRLVQAPAWAQSEVPPEVVTAAAARTGGEVVAGVRVGEDWRLVVQVVDPAGVSWPLVVWSDGAGNPIPVPAHPVQP